MSKAQKPWEIKKLTYQEWGQNKHDWENEYKLMYSVESYFFRYDNFIKGNESDVILRSVFGNKNYEDIVKDIKYWFNKCIGAYNVINLNKNETKKNQNNQKNR